MTKRQTKFFIGSLLCILAFHEISGATRTKSSQKTATLPIKTHVNEQCIIDEIKSLLKDGKVPNLSFNEWIDAHVPILLDSDKSSVAQLGKTLQAIRQGNILSVSGFKILPQFEKAVQAYDSTFKISMFSKPVIIAKGTYWYFSSPRKK